MTFAHFAHSFFLHFRFEYEKIDFMPELFNLHFGVKFTCKFENEKIKKFRIYANRAPPHIAFKAHILILHNLMNS